MAINIYGYRLILLLNCMAINSLENVDYMGQFGEFQQYIFDILIDYFVSKCTVKKLEQN